MPAAEAHRPRPLRVAIVGAGKMGSHHARAIAHLGGRATVTDVVDPSPLALSEAADVVPNAGRHDSLDALLAARAPDVVHVCTAPETHEALALQALGAGCHVYVEKPFTPGAEGARRVLELGRAKGLGVCAGHQLLFEAPTVDALSLLPSVREVVHLESYFSFRPVRTSRDGRATMSPDAQLLDILPHPLYLLLRFLEEAAPAGESEVGSVEVGPGGTVHALIRRGGVTGSLTVTLEGRPVESFLRVVGRNGSLHADYVRGTVQRLIGPGTSGIDKVLGPLRLSRQLAFGTTRAVAGRILSRRRSYPGLAEIFAAFYRSIREGGEDPTPAGGILETVRLSERIAAAMASPRSGAVPVEESGTRVRGPLNERGTPAARGMPAERGTPAEQGMPAELGAPVERGKPRPPGQRRRVLVTGGTGFLGREVARQLVETGAEVTALSRREPARWERLPSVSYRVADLGGELPAEGLGSFDTVIHCAAETAGGWDAHRRNSIEATRTILEECVADAGNGRRADLIHVSSIAVLAPPAGREAVREESPLHADGRAVGPYVWGKLESERLVREMGARLGLGVRVVRPPALVDYRRFEAPGKLGRTIGNVAVAVGAPNEPLAVVDVESAARTITWMAWHFDEAPEVLNLLPPLLPTRRELVERLRRTNPDLRVLWLPRPLLHPLSWLALGAQRVLRPGASPISLARVFARQSYDNARSAALEPQVERFFREADEVRRIPEERAQQGESASGPEATSAEPAENPGPDATPAADGSATRDQSGEASESSPARARAG